MDIIKPAQKNTFITKENQLLEILKTNINKFVCTICLNKEIESGQYAKLTQTLRDKGYRFLPSGQQWVHTLLCEKCEKKTKHIKMLEGMNEEVNIRITLTEKTRDRILTYFSFKDNFDCSVSNKKELEIDHRVPAKHLSDIENVNSLPTEELIKIYQPLTKRHNNIKREECKKCSNGVERRKVIWDVETTLDKNCDTCYYAFPETYRGA